MRDLMRKVMTVAAALGALSLTTVAEAVVIQVGPGDPSWFDTGSSGGGSSGIESTSLLDGDGAARLRGDRTRFAYCGNCAPPGLFNPVNNFGLLNDLTAFSFQWTVQATGAGVATAQAPALRLHVADPVNSRFLQFIWEDGEQPLVEQQFINGGAFGTLGQTYTGDFFAAIAENVHVFTSGGFGRGLFDAGGTLIPGSDAARPLSAHLADLTAAQRDQIFAFALSVGVGSSVGAGFDGFADRVNVQFAGGPATTFNFVVPEPGTLALFGAGLAGLGLVGRRRRAKRCVRSVTG